MYVAKCIFWCLEDKTWWFMLGQLISYNFLCSWLWLLRRSPFNLISSQGHRKIKVLDTKRWGRVKLSHYLVSLSHYLVSLSNIRLIILTLTLKKQMQETFRCASTIFYVRKDSSELKCIMFIYMLLGYIYTHIIYIYIYPVLEFFFQSKTTHLLWKQNYPK